MGLTHRVDADSDSREYIPTADSPFYRCFPTPPFRLSFHLCFRVVPVCVSSFPVGSFGERVLRSGLVERSAPSSVARVCHLTPLCTRTTLCRLSLLHHRRRWVSLTYHAILVWGPRFGVSLRLQMQGGARHMVGPQRLRLLLPLLRLDPNHTWFLRRPVLPSFRDLARLFVILLHSLSLFTVSTLVCHHRPLRRARQPTTPPV